MTAFDRQQIIEAAARTIHDDACLYYHHRDEEPPGCHIDIARRDAAIALPVIVAAVLKPIREQHASHVRAEYDDPDCEDSACDHYDELNGRWWCPSRPVWVCRACDQGADARVMAPCRTVQLCDEIEAAAKGGE